MQSGGRLVFGRFEFDLRTRELWSRGRRLHLQPTPAKVLELLLLSPGELVTREALRAGVWGADTFVDFEHSLNFCIRRIRDVLKDDANKPRFIETLPRRGYRFKGAVTLASQVAKLAPEPPQISEAAKVQAYEHYMKATKLFREQGKDGLQQAAEEYRRALELNPGYAMAHAGLGATIALRMLNRRDPAELDEAVLHLQTAVDLDAEAAEPYTWLCYTRIRRAETAAAIAAGQTAVSLQPDSAQARYFLGLAYFASCEEGASHYQQAVDQLLVATNVGPRWHPTWFVLSYAALLHGDHAAATLFAERLARLGNQPGVPFLGAEIVLGTVHLHQAKLEDARRILADFLERTALTDHMYKDAMSSIAGCVLGEVEVRTGSPEAALAAYRRAWQTLQEHTRVVAHARISARVLSGMAVAYDQLRQHDRAQSLLAKAVDLAQEGVPVSWASAGANLAELYVVLAAAHVRLGKHGDALNLLERAVAAGWRDADWLERDPELTPLQTQPVFRECVYAIRRAGKVNFERGQGSPRGEPDQPSIAKTAWTV